jgi:hypothetical protein
VPAAAGLYRGGRDAKFDSVVEQVRLRSSFIYLANAVNDLRGNWLILALVLAPLVLSASLCLLPDAIKLQHDLVHDLAPGAQSVAFIPAQEPQAVQLAPAFSFGIDIPTRPLHILALLITFMVNLVVLFALKRMHAGVRAPSALLEAIEVYRHAVPLVPSFFLILLLQVLATVVGLVLLIIPGLLAFIWLYFSQYALVFDGLRSWPALIHSRDLMRRRFFKVATRILVFLAVWSGYNSWVGGFFVVVSLLLGPLGYLTGRLAAAIFVIDLLAVAVAFVTTAFFFAAGARLYRDLQQISGKTAERRTPVDSPTAPLTELTA